VRFADPSGNEPLDRFVGDPRQRAREQRPDDGGPVVTRPPHPVEEPRDHAILDEVHVLDDVHEHIARGHEPRVEHRAADGHGQAGEPPAAPIANPDHRDDQRCDDHRGDGAADDQLKTVSGTPQELPSGYRRQMATR